MKFFNETGSWDWNPDNYLTPFDSITSSSMLRSKELSVYYGTTASAKVAPVATINSNLLKAMQRLFLLQHGYAIGGAAETDRGYIVELEIISNDDLKKIVTDEVKPEDVSAGKMTAFLNRKTKAWMVSVPDSTGKAVTFTIDECPEPYWMLVLMEAIDNEPSREAAELWDEYIELQKHYIEHPGSSASEKMLGCCAKLCDNVYRRLVYPDVADSKYSGGALRLPDPDVKMTFQTSLFAALKVMDGFGMINGKKVTSSSEGKKPTVKADKTGGAKETPVSIDELAGFYNPNPERVLNEEEKALIPEIPQSYDISPEVVRVCSLIKKSTALPTAKRNFIFIGGAGSGKSEAAKMVAYALGRPMLHLATDPDTDKMDLANSCIPDGKGGFVWVESPLMEAIEKGYVCEITEADLIVKSGTLGYLNPLFDKTASFQLNTGRVIRRHPDAVVIYTINGTYEGCRNMNQAVKDRCKIIPFATPDDDTLLHRVMTESGLTDKDIIKKMIDVLHRVEDHCATNYITDGTAGVRSLIDWAGDVACGEDPWDSAFSSIVWKWTFDENEHDALMRCVETQFERGSLWTA